MKRLTRLALVLLCLLLILAGAVALGSRFYLNRSGPLTQPATVVINPGSGSGTIAESLTAHGIIHEAISFKVAVRALGVAGSLKAGEYRFEPGQSLHAVIDKIAAGDTENRAVTIPEGYTVAQVIKTLENNPALSGQTSLPPEGMLFPDTYQFRLGTERTTLMKTMQDRAEQELRDAWHNRAGGLPYSSPEDLLIMASIVQKEAASDAEMPRIAAVFTNRLRLGMKLQADPTVIYGAEMTGKKILKKDLTEPHPFNTYVYKGLPPTPISNPGRAALQAAAHPATENSIYFVADPSRTHHVFSSTYAEHQKNVARYWKLVGTVAQSATATLTVPPEVSATLVSPSALTRGRTSSTKPAK